MKEPLVYFLCSFSLTLIGLIAERRWERRNHVRENRFDWYECGAGNISDV